VRRIVATAFALAACAAGAADTLGTLFTTAEERDRLDRLRRGEPVTASQAAPPRPAEVTGFVQRSDGRNTVFIDGVPTPTRSSKAAPLLEPDAVQGSAREGVRVEKRTPR
jgi:hypothetical protein